jgi:glutaredoxin 3
MITIYGASWCGPCHTTKGYLDKLGIKYEYHDVELEPATGLTAVNLSGQRGIPVIDIDGEIIVGFDRPRLDAALAAHPQT